MSAVLIDRPSSLPSGWGVLPLSGDAGIREEANVLKKTGVLKDARSLHLFDGIIGDSPVLQSALKQAELVAPTDSTVMIQGETGTGKELIADAIHHLSPRRHHHFIKLNCAAIPPTLFESELFGHERGAFTGAINQRVGRLELAHKGTLFLDEIGDLPLELQPKLLRVLQEQGFERLGSSRTIKADVRVIAATHRDLSRMVQEGRFRSDLYYRLNIIPIIAPPLRERREDILLLARYFARKFAHRLNKRIADFPPEAVEALVSYDWPGNVRELQNVIERAVVLSVDGVPRTAIPELTRSIRAASSLSKTLEEVEREHILSVLKETNWVIGGQEGAARRLGINRTTLTFRMRKLGIVRPALCQ
jgi:formate hydrogenlyase transcriptional activator